MSQVIHTQRPATSSNANEAALTGFNLETPDFIRIDNIILSTARTKKGGYNLQAGVLFTKVCKEIKSLAGMSEHQRIPDNIAGYIQSGCNKVATHATKELLDSGFNPLRQSAQKVVYDFRNTRVNRQVTQVYQKIQSFVDQLKDVHWGITQTEEELQKHEEKQPKDAEQAARFEEKAARLKEKLERLQKLERSIKNEKTYHEEQLAKANE